MSLRAVCRGSDSHEELVDEAFKVNGRYVLVGGVPASVCQRSGERSFSRETTEKVRLLVHGQAATARSVPLQVYEFA